MLSLSELPPEAKDALLRQARQELARAAGKAGRGACKVRKVTSKQGQRAAKIRWDRYRAEKAKQAAQEQTP
jgi:hypothetical protein